MGAPTMQAELEARRRVHRLTDKAARNATSAGPDLLLSDGNSLYLRVRPNSKTWIVRRKRAGRVQVITLGNYPELSVKAARDEAAKLEAKRGPAAAVGVTVGSAADEFLRDMILPKYRRTANAETYARRIKQHLGSRALANLQPIEITAMVRADAKAHPVAANRLLAFTKHFLGWCVEVGYLTSNPAADLTRRIAGGDEAPRARVLTHDEIRRFWHAPDLQSRALLRFLLLSGLRIAEAQRATRDHLAGSRLLIPKDHSKNGKAHWVHLPEMAAAQIEGTHGLFRNISPTAVQAALRRWHVKHKAEPWTPHDLRRTFATGMGDLGIPPHIIARCLNHTIPGSESLPVYLRSEWEAERIEAAERWAARLAEIVA